jgi:hypothetical protein
VASAYAGGFLSARAVDGALAGIPATAVALIAGSAGYALAFVLTGGVRPRDRKRLREVIETRTRRRSLANVGAR